MSKWISILVLIFTYCHCTGQNNPPKSQAKVFISLDQYIDFAIQNNPSIQQAILNEKIQQQNHNAAIAPMLPTVNAQASINDNLILISTILPAQFAKLLGTDAVQFGQKYNINPNGSFNLNLINAANYQNLMIAKKNEQIAAANTQLSIEQIKISLAQAYYLYLLYNSNYDFARQDLMNADSLLYITQVRYDNQYIDELDLNRSKSSDLQFQNAVDQNKVLQQKALNNLKLLAGLATTDDIMIEDKLEIRNETLSDIITTNPMSRPEIQVSVLKVVVNQMTINREKLNFSPELSVYGAYGVIGYNNNFRFAETGQQWFQNSSVGVALNVPIFAGGLKYYNLQKAKLNQQIAQLDLQNTKLQTEKEDQDLLLDYVKAKADLKVRQQQLFLSDRDYKLALVKYKNDNISYDNVINVRNELLNAQQLLIQAQADYITAQYKIKIINSYDKK